MGFHDFIVSQVGKHDGLGQLVKAVAQKAFPQNVVLLEYPVQSRPRWHQQTPHPSLYNLIAARRPVYETHLRAFLQFGCFFDSIAERREGASDAGNPEWLNGWMPALDAVALYSFLALTNPRYYLEVGSGNSTRFARRAIADHKLRTEIISIDPSPRVEVDQLCDQTIRQPVEQVPLTTFDILGADDVLYIDSSHRVFMNSDVTMLFLDVLPRLMPGVLVQIHDVSLPYDYPTHWAGRFYSEQYVLAAYLLAQGNWLEIELPNTFISDDPALQALLAPLWARAVMTRVERWGCSFWLRTRGVNPLPS